MSRSTTLLRSRTLLLACAGALVCGPAAAQPAPTAADRKAKIATARQYVEAGRAALEKLNNHDAAVQWFQLAYDLVPEPVLLYNMANAHRLAGHDRQALELYERYLAAEPDGQAAGDAKRWVAPLRATVAADDARRAEEARAAEEIARVAREAEEARQREAAVLAEKARRYDEAEAEKARRRKEAGDRARANLAPRRALVDRERQQAAERRRLDRYHRVGIGTGVAGVVSLGVGIYFGVRASRLATELQTVYDPRVFADGQFAERVQVRALVAGGALVLAGSGLLYYERRARRRTASLTITPTDEADGAAVTLVGSW